MAAYEASRGELNRDGNQGSATDDYLATPDQRFPSVSSQRIKKRSFPPALWIYVCLFYWDSLKRAAELSAFKLTEYVQIDAHMVIILYVATLATAEMIYKTDASQNGY